MAGQGQTQEIGVGKASDSRRQRHRCLRRGAEETLCEARHPAAAPGTLDEGIEVHAVDAAFDDIADGLAVGGGAGLVIAGAGEGGGGSVNLASVCYLGGSPSTPSHGQCLLVGTDPSTLLRQRIPWTREAPIYFATGFPAAFQAVMPPSKSYTVKPAVRSCSAAVALRLPLLQ